MPTSRPMPPRVAAIKRAIETRLDFSVLADGGEAAVVQYGRSCGLNGRALICEWQQTALAKRWPRQRVAQAERHGGGRTSTSAAIAANEKGRTVDLDYWPDVEAAEPTDDDGDMVPCAACDGRGRDAAGNRCSICGGSGKIRDDGDEEDREDEED